MSVNSYIDQFDRICVDGVCHCDWRVTLRDCVEGKAMTIVYGINVGLSSLCFILGTALLLHRLFIKGHRLFDISLEQGCFRPKPIDSMILFLNMFNILRLISSIILITNICDDPITRSFIFEFPWQFGIGAFALYLIGMTQTLADSHKVIVNNWLPPPRLADLIGAIIFFGPFVTNNAMSLAAGIMATKNDIGRAIIFTRLLYVFWFIQCTCLAVAVFLCGYRLTRILRNHLEKFNTTGPRYVAVQSGIIKIRIVMAMIIGCMFCFATFLLLFGILRNLIIVNTIGSIVLGTIWNLLGALTSFTVLWAIVFNPKVDVPAKLGLKTSSQEKSNPQSNNFATFSNNHTTHDHPDKTVSYPPAADGDIQETLSNNRFDELKLQQLQYQNVFHKHNQHQLPHNTNNRSAQMTGIGVSAAEFSVEDSEYYERKNDSVDDERVLSHSRTDSELDLVGYASKH